MDARITLESPFPLYAVPRVFSWMQQTWDKVADDFAPQDVHSFVVDWLEKKKSGRRSWAVLNDGELVGTVTSARLNPVVADLHFAFRRDFWGRGNTVPALALACEAIFATGVEKISSLAFADNRAVVGIAMANGAVREGLLRRHTRQNGKPVDVLLLGFTKEAFDGVIANRRVQRPEQQRPVREHDDRLEQRHKHGDQESDAVTVLAHEPDELNDHADDAESAVVREPVAAGGR